MKLRLRAKPRIVDLLLAALEVVFGVLCSLSVFMLLGGPHTGWVDFRQIYSGLEKFVQGSNPYDQTGFFNPLWWAVILSPLTALGYVLAAEVWFWLGLLAVLASGLLLTRDWPLRPRLLVLPGMLAFVPSLNSLIHGQVSPFVLLGATLPLLAGSRSRGLALFSLPLLTLKPHLGLSIAAVIVLLWCKEKQLKLAALSLLSLPLLAIAAFLARPSWVSDFLAAVSSSSILATPTPVLGRILSQVLPSGVAWALHWAIGLTLTVGMVFWLLKRQPSRDLALALSCAVGLLVTPYAHSYDFVLLLPAVASLWGNGDSHGPVLTSRAAAILVYFFPVGQFLGVFGEATLVLLPLGTSAALLALGERRWRLATRPEPLRGAAEPAG